MAAALAVAPEGWMSVREYLASSFELDVDYVDGYVEERQIGELDHSKWQVAIVAWLMLHCAELQVKPFISLSLRVSPTRVRIADVCTYLSTEPPTEAIPSLPPLAVFEIMSPKDRFSRTLVRLEDYGAMGVRNIFVIGSRERIYKYECRSLRVIREGSSPLVGSDAVVTWAEVLALRS